MAATDRYEKNEAKEWARENFDGVCNVIIPSYRADLSALNEEAIRHDVERNVELGFWGALLVSELALTRAEMRRFMEVAVEAAAGRQYFVLHGSFDTVEALVERAADARAIGVDALLLCYPNSFYPRSREDLAAYVREVADRTDLAIILFSAPHFNLDRLDPRGYPLDCMVELAAHPSVVAIKHEVGQPGVIGSWEVFKRLEGSGVIVTDPYEPNALLWTELFDVQWLGTSNYEYLGGSVPRMFELVRAGRREEALEIYWQVQPARRSRARVQANFSGANFNHRYLWKYQAWLQGYSGGPLRMPAMKLTDDQMRDVAAAAVDAGLIPAAPSDLAEFFLGRCPG
jgi:4-hydroxy-tetrahydrodipicolinate synthase